MNRLATTFSFVTTIGILLAAVSGVVWIVAALRHRETVAKTLCIAGIIVAVVGFAMFLKNYDSSLHQEREPQAPTTQTATPEPPQEPAQEPVSAPSDEQKGISQEPTAPPQEPVQAANAVNPLLALEVQTRPVMNGFKTEQIGTWAYIETTKEFLSGATDEQLFQYLNKISENQYNWINVFFEDGTGLYCMPSMGGYYIEYGLADGDEGGAVMPTDDLSVRYFQFKDGVYIENTDE